MTLQAPTNRWSLFSRMVSVVLFSGPRRLRCSVYIFCDGRTDTMCENNDHLFGHGLVGQKVVRKKQGKQKLKRLCSRNTTQAWSVHLWNCKTCDKLLINTCYSWNTLKRRGKKVFLLYFATINETRKCLKQILTRQVSSMIHSARPTVSPVVNVFAWNLFCFAKWGRTDGRTYERTTCEKIMITAGRDCRSAEWINILVFLVDVNWFSFCWPAKTRISPVSQIWRDATGISLLYQQVSCMSGFRFPF